MGERKVLNRYIPPDFDPSLLPKMKRDRKQMMEIRMMLPFSLRCKTCGEYMYRGTKFNSKKEDTEEYYMDPKNSDYECESGASRNFELWRDTQTIVEEDSKAKEEEEALDAMKALENRTLDNKMEMDVLDALDEIKAMNQKHNRVHADKVLESIQRRAEKVAEPKSVSTVSSSLTAEDEALVKSVQFRSADPSAVATMAIAVGKKTLLSQVSLQPSQGSSASSLPVVVVKKKRKAEAVIADNSQPLLTKKPQEEKEEEKKKLVKEEKNESLKSDNKVQTTGLGGLLDYGDSSGDDGEGSSST
eukprot:scaffold474_cov169-Ochromonas_danica.AAC.13